MKKKIFVGALVVAVIGVVVGVLVGCKKPLKIADFIGEDDIEDSFWDNIESLK